MTDLRLEGLEIIIRRSQCTAVYKSDSDGGKVKYILFLGAFKLFNAHAKLIWTQK